MTAREVSIPGRTVVDLVPGVRIVLHTDAAVHATVVVDEAARTDAAWTELCQATTELGTAAARWDVARAAYVEASKTHPRSGPPPAEGGAPTAPTT